MKILLLLLLLLAILLNLEIIKADEIKTTNLDLLKIKKTNNNNDKSDDYLIYNFSNDLLWKPSLKPNGTDNVLIDSGFNIVVNKSTKIKSLDIKSNSSLLIKDQLWIYDKFTSENGSILIFDANSIDNGTMVVGGEVNIFGSIFIESYFSIYTMNRLNIFGELNLGGICYINSYTKLSGFQNGFYGSMFIFTNDTEFDRNFMVLDTSLMDFIGKDCSYLMSNGSLSTLIHSMLSILETSLRLKQSKLILNESVQIINNSNVTIDINSAINIHKNSTLKINNTEFIIDGSTLVFEYFSNGTIEDSIFKLYNKSSILFYNGSYVEVKSGQMLLFDSYLDIFNGSELVINGTFENFRVYNQTAVEISHLGRCSIIGRLNLFDQSSFKCKKGSELLINGTLVHYHNSFINSTLASIYLNGDLILKDNSFVQSVDSIFNINGNLIMEMNTTLKIKNSTFIVPGSIYLNSSIILNSSFLFLNGSFIAHTDSPSNFTNSVLNVTGEIYLDGVLSFNKTLIQTNSNFSIGGDIIGNNMNISTFGHFIIGKNASFLCDGCILDIGKKGEFIYDEFSVIKLNNTKININPLGSVKSLGIIHVIHGTSITNIGNFEHSSHIYHNHKNGDLSLINESIIRNKGNWKCIDVNETTLSNKSQIDLPFYNDGGVLDISGSHTIFKLFYQDNNGKISLSNNGSLSSIKPLNIKNGYLIGNGSIIGTVNMSGEIGQQYKPNQLYIDGDLHFSSENSKIVVTIGKYKSYTIINVNKTINLTQCNNGCELVFLIHEDMVSNGEFEFLKYNSIVGSNFSSIKFSTYNTGINNNKETTINSSTINGCQVSIKKGQKSMALMFNSCIERNSIPVYTYIFSAVGVVCVGLIVSLGIQNRHKIKTKYLQWKDRTRELKYNNNKK
ncbi:hypothetical protein RB653_010162 [Dictyostelium firmibasis]|uniref:Transmembrane protein n=1 Tax=Dictyostelium firmibasis TaxID=79012 RepID=A0AAN7U0N0_9MYCE